MRIIILLGLCVNAEALLAEIPLAISKKAPNIGVVCFVHRLRIEHGHRPPNR
jgi:hypothetical protein